VSSRRVILILALALALGVQTTYADPGAAAAEVRAMTCCAHHCDHPLSPASARRCCGLTVAASGPAEGPISPRVPSLTAGVFTASPAAPALPAPIRAWADAMPAGGSGPPAFLFHRHLLI
jgi:hypothetical protein